jgi:hypothetical protein
MWKRVFFFFKKKNTSNQEHNRGKQKLKERSRIEGKRIFDQ